MGFNGTLELIKEMHIIKIFYNCSFSQIRGARKNSHKLCKKDGKLESHIESLLEELQSSPYLGEKLEVNFPGFRSIHFCGNKYRIIYKIYAETQKILVLIIGCRKDAYSELAKWLRESK